MDINFLTSLDNDLGRTYVPVYTFIRETFLNYHQIPLWWPNQMMGDTFIGNPLSSVLYPANLIFAFFSVNAGIVIYLLLHFLLALLSTYFLAKNFGLSKTASIAAALFYALSTKMLVHLEAGHITMIAAFSYFPLLFLATRELIKKPQFKYLILGAVSLSAMYFTYATIFLYAVIFIAFYVFYYIILYIRFDVNKIIQKLISLVVLVLVTLGISAAVLLPQLEYGPYSTRSQLAFEDVALPLFNIETISYSLLYPYQIMKDLGHESLLYLTAIPIVFSIFGCLFLKRKQQLVLLIFVILAILFAAGQSTPIFRIAYELFPPLQYTRVTTRFWFIVTLMAALLAAYGLQKIKNPKVVYLAIIIFLLESMFIFAKRINNLGSLNFANENLYIFLSKDPDIFRVYCTTYCFNPQMLSKYKINQLAGETPIQNATFVEFLEKAGNYNWNRFAVIFPPYQIWQVENPPIPNSQLLGFANVKYTASNYDLRDAAFEFKGKFDGIYLFENLNFQKRFRFENLRDQVTVLKYTPNIVDLSFEKSDVNRDLVISENYYPGWYAIIDGQKYKLERANKYFKKVNIPPNTDLVQLKYEPTSLLAGKTISIGTILFLLMYFWYTRYTRIKSHG